MSDALLHPDFKPTPYWWEAAAPTDRGNAAPPAHTDVLVVGGGYAGLSAALELARGGRSVVVAEAALFGHGASSRNGGAVSSGVNLGKGIAGGSSKAQSDSAIRRIEGLLGESRKAFDKVGELIAREGIDCHFETRGRLIGAYTPKHYAGFAARAELLNRVCDAGARLLPRERLREEMASDYYYGAMTMDCAGKLHPALYHKGLLDACARAGAQLCANTRVTAAGGGRGGFTVTTSKGTVQCAETVIATNGYTGPLTPELRKGLVPASSHIIVTEELSEDLCRSLIPNGRTISETPRVLCYYRMTPDGRRMMFGGRARFTDVPPEMRAALIRQMMVARFPQLADARVTHSWTGNIAFTYDFLPHLGIHRDMHYALGCNGSGVAIMTYLGYLMARRILQNNELESPFVGLDLPRLPLPGYTGNPWFLPMIGGWYRFLDRVDRLRA